ncbi:hypothetical protein ANO14919_026950 [Xylariales sp. No.14919]|nr:hypothetical protein F5X98DRAFT_377941 [Xylaria grammica]GAW13314.1 hypothetical protein ANO14919_026950 [Xylariales sp. No.14919]
MAPTPSKPLYALKYSKTYLQALCTITPTFKSSDSPQERNIISKLARPLSCLSPCLWSAEAPEHNLGLSLGEPTSPPNPIRKTSTISRPHIARPAETILEQTYAFGWNWTQLPGCMDLG